MTYHYSATGERIEDVDLERPANITSRTPDPVIVARCNELRRILREGRRSRQVQP